MLATNKDKLYNAGTGFDAFVDALRWYRRCCALRIVVCTAQQPFLLTLNVRLHDDEQLLVLALQLGTEEFHHLSVLQRESLI